MSIHVLSEVLERSRAKGVDRLVLIVLADNANRESREAWPAVRDIARRAGGIDRRTVQRCLRRLEQLGEIVPVRRGGGRENSAHYVIPPLPADLSERRQEVAFSEELKGGVEPPGGAAEMPLKGGADAVKGGTGAARTVRTHSEPSEKPLFPRFRRQGARGELPDLIDDILATLRRCTRFTVDDVNTRTQVENALEACPASPEQARAAAAVAVVWASDPAWRKTNPGGVFLDALRREVLRGGDRPTAGSGSDQAPRQNLGQQVIGRCACGSDAYVKLRGEPTCDDCALRTEVA